MTDPEPTHPLVSRVNAIAALAYRRDHQTEKEPMDPEQQQFEKGAAK